jgi:hypothetical protein
MRHRLLLLLIAFAGICWVQSLRATTLVRMSLDQLAQASSAIIRGRVVSQETRWNPRHTQILTYTTIAVGQTLKGTPPSRLVIEQIGGKVGNLRSYVPGTARIQAETDYVLFLEPSSAQPAHYLPVGMMQGVYRVYRDQTTGQERVILPLGSLERIMGGGMSAMQGPTVPFSTFRQEVGAASMAPVQIPRGTSFTVVIQSVGSQGTGRVELEGRIATDVFPNRGLVIPAGSPVAGSAQRVGDTWKIYWTEISIRGMTVPISASNQEPAGWSLQGMTLMVKVR